MKVKLEYLIVSAVILVAGVSIYYIFSASATSGNYDDFAKCLTQKGLVMYGTDWCKYCKNQKQLFGSSFSYIDYKNCDVDRALCEQEGIRGFPTWKINGQAYPGVRSLEELGSLTGCSLA